MEIGYFVSYSKELEGLHCVFHTMSTFEPVKPFFADIVHFVSTV